MDYQNRLPPEGINTTRVHPLKQFAQFSIGAIALVVMLVVVLQVTGSALARLIPFSFETSVVERLDVPLGEADKSPEMTDYLNQLAGQLSAQMALPEGMYVTVNYSSEDVFNAFATIGGNLLFYKRLLAGMENENMLAMVMAHEIAHVLHRDPVASLGGGIASTIALLGLTGSTGAGMAGQVLNNAGLLTSVQFTRKMEVAADKLALQALNAHYGHVAGAAELFELFGDVRGGEESERFPWLERFASTHPLDQDRIEQIERTAEAENWSLTGELTPLPENFGKWLQVN